jgi:hypothetical protein
VAPGVGNVGAGAEHRDGEPAARERAPVRGGVDTESEAARDRHARDRHRAAELLGHLERVRGGMAPADYRDGRGGVDLPQGGGVAAHEERVRLVLERSQRFRIAVAVTAERFETGRAHAGARRRGVEPRELPAQLVGRRAADRADQVVVREGEEQPRVAAASARPDLR